MATCSMAELAGEHVLNEHSEPTAPVAESLMKLRGLLRNSFADLAGTPVEPDKRLSNTPIAEIDSELNNLTSLVV